MEMILASPNDKKYSLCLLRLKSYINLEQVLRLNIMSFLTFFN